VRRFRELLQSWRVKDGKVPKGLQLYEQGLGEHSKPEVIFDNALMLVWIALGALGCYFLHPVATWVFLAFALAMAYLVLRKLVHKWPRCALRVGVLSALLFKQGGMIKIAPVVYGLLTLIPIVTLAISMTISFSTVKLIPLMQVLAISVYSGAVGRKRNCTRCKNENRLSWDRGKG